MKSNEYTLHFFAAQAAYKTDMYSSAQGPLLPASHIAKCQGARFDAIVLSNPVGALREQLKNCLNIVKDWEAHLEVTGQAVLAQAVRDALIPIHRAFIYSETVSVLETGATEPVFVYV